MDWSDNDCTWGLLFVNPKKFEKNNERFIFWEWAEADVGARDYYKQLFETIRNKSKRSMFDCMLRDRF